jgi:hypothetical protein
VVADLNARQPELIDLRRRDRPTLASLLQPRDERGRVRLYSRQRADRSAPLSYLLLPNTCSTAFMTGTLKFFSSLQ